MNELAKLRWQCRRGTKELDLLLLRYLDNQYLKSDNEEKALFIELLMLEDDHLLSILLDNCAFDSQRFIRITNAVKFSEGQIN